MKRNVLAVALGLYGLSSIAVAFYAESLDVKGQDNAFVFWMIALGVVISSVVLLSLYARKPLFILSLLVLFVPLLGLLMLPLIVLGLVVVNIWFYEKK